MEDARMWHLKTKTGFLVVVGTLGMIKKNADTHIKNHGRHKSYLEMKTKCLQ